MPETKADTMIRLRREAAAAEQDGKHLMNIAVLLVNGRNYDKAVSDAKSLLAEAAALRARVEQLESDGQTGDPGDSN
jgi:hypothetical protein